MDTPRVAFMRPLNVLLDLNYTLVSNSDIKRSPFIRQIEHEQYRGWLVELLLGHRIILVTARPSKYRGATLQRLRDTIGFEPDDAYFNDTPKPPHIFKRDLFDDILQKKYGHSGPFVAVESNPRTILEYRARGIACLSVTGVNP